MVRHGNIVEMTRGTSSFPDLRSVGRPGLEQPGAGTWSSSDEKARRPRARRWLVARIGVGHQVVNSGGQGPDTNRWKLGTLLGGITGSGLAAAFLSILLVRLALKSGLQPLEVVGEQAAKIDAGSLDRRFPTEGLPTELSPIANRLNDLMVRMEESFERERRFSADLAHELRTPVAELKSMSEVAIKWPEQADAKTDYQDVQDISERMQATIENLLMLTRLENSKARINREPVDLRSFVASCRKPFQANAEDRKIEFKDGIGKEESIESDGKLLRIVLENLISNAIEYAPKNSAIELSGRCETNRAQVFAIQNPAPDLTAADATHLFERLWRKDTSRTDDRHCGLGLSLAKSALISSDWNCAEKRETGCFSLDCPEAGDAGTGQLERNVFIMPRGYGLISSSPAIRHEQETPQQQAPASVAVSDSLAQTETVVITGFRSSRSGEPGPQDAGDRRSSMMAFLPARGAGCQQGWRNLQQGIGQCRGGSPHARQERRRQADRGRSSPQPSSRRWTPRWLVAVAGNAWWPRWSAGTRIWRSGR